MTIHNEGYNSHFTAAVKRSLDRLRQAQRTSVERLHGPCVTEHVGNGDRGFSSGGKFGPVHTNWIMKLRKLHMSRRCTCDKRGSLCLHQSSVNAHSYAYCSDSFGATKHDLIVCVQLIALGPSTKIAAYLKSVPVVLGFARSVAEAAACKVENAESAVVYA